MPEARAPSAESGLGQVARTITLEGLTQLSVDGRALPRLAERWTWENNGLRLRVTLQQGVKFHDGSLLDAALGARILTEAIDRPANRALYPSLNYVTSVRPSGSDEIVLEVSEPSAFLPEDLEIPLELRSPARGTGPFRFAREDPTEVVLDAFEQYRGGPPSIKRIVIKPFGTLRTAWTSLLRGDVDMVTDVAPEAVEFIRNDDVEVISFSRRYQFVIAFNSNRAPFESAAVRRALNLAVDREALVRKVLQGKGLPRSKSSGICITSASICSSSSCRSRNSTLVSAMVASMLL
jgi:peptide/nickel transport system substrate-binding protein